jgi:APA family basic amino acid/polyamine antiporter
MSSALVVGNMIGSGVFLLPAALGAFGGISLFGWLFTCTGAVLLALTFAHLSRLVPGAGGPYAYTRRGLGDFAGFLVAWGYWISAWAGNAAISVALVGYLGVFVPFLSRSPAVAAVVALASIWVLTWVNAMGIRNAGFVQLVTTVLKLVPLVVIGTIGLFYVRLDYFTPFNASGGSGFSAVTATAALTLWAFLGLESATVPADQVVDPERTIPRSTVLGTVVTAAVYVLGTFVVMGVVSPADLSNSTAPFADAASVMWGPWAAYLVAAGAAFSAFGALNGWILIQGQIPRAAAIDGLFPSRFGRMSSRQTPVFGLVVSSVLVTLLMVTNYTANLVELFTFIILLATLTSLVPYLFCATAHLIILLANGSPIVRDKKGVYIGIAGLAFCYSLWAIAGAGQEVVYWGFLLLMAGVPVYVWTKWRGGNK